MPWRLDGCQGRDWLVRVRDAGSQASWELGLAQLSDRTAEPGASMDGVDVWASTLAQLMAKRKPQDTWELVPEENLASGHVEGGGFQYRLRGLSRCAAVGRGLDGVLGGEGLKLLNPQLSRP